MRKAFKFFGGTMDGKHRSAEVSWDQDTLTLPGPIVGTYNHPDGTEEQVRASDQVYDLFDNDAVLRLEQGG